MDNSDIIEKLTRVEEKAKSNTKRLDDHDDRIDNLERTYSILENVNYRMGKVETSIEKIDKKLDTKVSEDEKNKSKKWDKLIDYLFYAVIGIVLSYIAVKLGLK